MNLCKHISSLESLSGLLFCLLLLVIEVSVQGLPGYFIQGRVLYQYHPANLTQSQASDTCRARGLSLLQVNNQDGHESLLNVTATLGIQGPFWLQGRGEVTDWHWVSDNSPLANQGCYKDYGGAPDLPREVELQDVVPDLCIEACGNLGYTYAGLQSGYQCFCGDSYGQYNLSQGAPWCSVSCEGDPNQYCGGWNRNTVYYINGSFSTWAYQQPDDLSGDESCGVLESSSLDHQFSDQSCYYLYHYLCDIPSENCSETVDSFLQEKSKCYYLSREARSWFNARADCLSLGGDLIKIDSEETFARVQTLLAERGRTDKHWIGLTKKTWLSGSNEMMETFFWLDEQPGHVAWECLAHEVEGQGWVNLDCEEELPFVCMKEMAEQTTTERISTTFVDTTTSSLTTESTSGEPTITDLSRTTEVTHTTAEDYTSSLKVTSLSHIQHSSGTDSIDVTGVGLTKPPPESTASLPESGKQTDSEGWTIQKIAILVGVLGGIFLATTVVGSVVLFKLKCRPSSHNASSARVAPAMTDSKPSGDQNQNTETNKEGDPETQIQKEDVQRLEREQKAAMAVTCSDVKVKQPVRSLESLC